MPVLLKQKIENHAMTLIAGALVCGVSIGWIASEKVRVDPLIMTLDRLEKHDIPNLLKGDSPVLEPQQQCEIVRLYEELSIAIEKADQKAIFSLYENNYSPATSDDIMLQAYKNLLGKKTLFYISLIRHNDDRTVAVNVKAFLPSGKYIDSKDTLVFGDSGWKFLRQ